jgi:hypothetical protein
MKKIVLMMILSFYCFKVESKNYEKEIVVAILNHFFEQENILKNDIYICSNWNIQSVLDDLQIKFLNINKDSLNEKMVFIDQPLIIKDNIAIGVGYIENFFYKTYKSYYLFKYESLINMYQLINVSNNISREWNDILYGEIIQKMIKDNYKPEDTIYVNLFDDINLPNKIEKNVIINLSNKEKSDKWYQSYFSSKNSKPFYLNEISPIISKGIIQIKIRKKNIIDYDMKSKNPIYFVVVKAWDEYEYQVKYSLKKKKYKIKKK